MVNREMVAVLTSGTMTDAEMLQSHPDASYLMAITESALPPGPDSIDAAPVTIGVCAVDAATGQMLLGQWCATLIYPQSDDPQASPLPSHVEPLNPRTLSPRRTDDDLRAQHCT